MREGGSPVPWRCAPKENRPFLLPYSTTAGHCAAGMGTFNKLLPLLGRAASTACMVITIVFAILRYQGRPIRRHATSFWQFDSTSPRHAKHVFFVVCVGPQINRCHAHLPWRHISNIFHNRYWTAKYSLSFYTNYFKQQYVLLYRGLDPTLTRLLLSIPLTRLTLHFKCRSYSVSIVSQRGIRASSHIRRKVKNTVIYFQ